MAGKRAIPIGLCLCQTACMTTPAPFDVPYNVNGTPVVNSIVERINCELVELVRDDRQQVFKRQPTLLRYDFHASMLLVIESTESGAIAPVFNFPHTGFSFGVSPSFKKSREDQKGYNLEFSFVDIYEAWRANPGRYPCPDIDTDLAADLGLRETVASALNLEELNFGSSLSPAAGVFNGAVNFTATRSINSIGPTWTLTHFNGPGPLLSGSIATNNKLSFGFGGGPNPNKARQRDAANRSIARARAQLGLGQALTTDIGIQLNAIRNDLR